MPNKKASPQFALTQMRNSPLRFGAFSKPNEIKKGIERDKYKAHKKTASAVCFDANEELAIEGIGANSKLKEILK